MGSGPRNVSVQINSNCMTDLFVRETSELFVYFFAASTHSSECHIDCERRRRRDINSRSVSDRTLVAVVRGVSASCTTDISVFNRSNQTASDPQFCKFLNDPKFNQILIQNLIKSQNQNPDLK